jgi:hypothetical protein
MTEAWSVRVVHRGLVLVMMLRFAMMDNAGSGQCPLARWKRV